MGSHSRNKGKRYEQLIARHYRERGYEAKRGLQSREGDEVSDVITSLPLSIECKHHHRGGLLFRAMKQAQAAANLSETPIVHIHEDNGENLVAMTAFDYFRWLAVVAPVLFRDDGVRSDGR